MNWEMIKDANYPDTWRVEAVGSDGEVYIAVFSGPRARIRAEEYAISKTLADAAFGGRT